MFGQESPAAFQPGTAGLPKDAAHERNAPPSSDSADAGRAQVYPCGLLGDVQRFIYQSAPHPNEHIALAGAIGLMAGITGKAFNTYTNAGLNQYILLLANTAMGKEAIKSGIDRLLSAVAKSVPAATDFRGPVIVSSAGVLKWLDKRPSIVSVIGEFGYKLKAFSSPRVNPNDEALNATLLDLYGKSGAGGIVDPMAYSDTQKHTGVIVAPNVNIIGESVPGVVFEALNERMVTSGLLPRFMLIEAIGQRSPLNENPVRTPDPAFQQALADLCGQCLTLNHSNTVVTVEADAEAKAKFREFGAWVDSQINAHSSGAYRELWSRAFLKALKLASLHAVGMNPNAPKVTLGETMWATNLIVAQTQALIAKFDNDETGAEAGNEAKQLRKLRAVIREYIKAEAGKYEKSGCTFEMHRNHHFTHKYLSNRLIKLPMFRDDKITATKALERAVRHLLDNDEIRGITPGDMVKAYGRAAKSYAVTSESEFMRGDD